MNNITPDITYNNIKKYLYHIIKSKSPHNITIDSINNEYEYVKISYDISNEKFNTQRYTFNIKFDDYNIFLRKLKLIKLKTTITKEDYH